MKSLIFALALASCLSAQARESQGSLKCSVDTRAVDGTVVQFESRLISISTKSDGSSSSAMWEPVATFTDDDRNGEVTVGRKDHLQADAGYKPRKYKGTVRFDLSNLVDTKTFGAFLPSDSCSLKLMIPVDAIEQGSFKAPLVINCDQSGGSKTMSCTSTPRN